MKMDMRTAVGLFSVKEAVVYYFNYGFPYNNLLQLLEEYHDTMISLRKLRCHRDGCIFSIQNDSKDDNYSIFAENVFKAQSPLYLHAKTHKLN